ncbi:hypothetical protein AcW1_010225 [Taiwanofungus camphoratus]|nr:hypothetical protein AcV5_003112 [Antrodia cinnamomea]KAI0946897.1 hypothetical protein AcW1_010225 [Antrodia cinnamomea]KAI0954400.1 hypothetical protein AcV7_007648 [Antrodia cinnamomea]
MHAARPTNIRFRLTCQWPRHFSFSPNVDLQHSHSWFSSPTPSPNVRISPPPSPQFHAVTNTSAYPICVLIHPVIHASFETAIRDARVSDSVRKAGQNPEPGKLDPEQQPEPERTDEISDQEWEIRTGRAIYVLQQTLPDFFQTGLVTSAEIPTLQPPISDTAAKAASEQSIYSPNIQLAYTPPVALPAPFPRTLHVEGLTFYTASFAFIRHTLGALYTDLRVDLRSVRVHGPRSSSGKGPLPTQGLEPGLEGAPPGAERPRSLREKSLFVGLSLSGVARVSGAQSGWEV